MPPGELFRLFNSGKHLNRVAEPALWAELERCQESYQAILPPWGFELKVEPRGYAWFHIEESAAKPARLASAWRCYGCACLIPRLMRADPCPALRVAGDKALLAEAHEHHQEIL